MVLTVAQAGLEASASADKRQQSNNGALSSTQPCRMHTASHRGNQRALSRRGKNKLIVCADDQIYHCRCNPCLGSCSCGCVRHACRWQDSIQQAAPPQKKAAINDRLTGETAPAICWGFGIELVLESLRVLLVPVLSHCGTANVLGYCSELHQVLGNVTSSKSIANTMFISPTLAPSSLTACKAIAKIETGQ